MAEEPLSVDPERLAAAAQRLLAAAEAIPTPPAPQAATGSDPLSQAIAAQAGKVEAPVTEGLPTVQKEAMGNAEQVTAAARAYETTDRQLGDEINKRTFPDPDRSENKHNGRVQLVDWKQGPTPTPSPGHTGQDVSKAIKDLPKGTAPFIKEVRGEQDLRNLWNWASEGGTQRAGSSYPGTERVLPDGTIVGIRESGEHGPTMDIRTPDNTYAKVHVNPSRGGVPEIPVRAAGPPEGGAPGARAPEGAAPGPRAPVAPAPVEPPPAPRPAPGPFVPMGPNDPNAFPHPVQPPHSHHEPPVLGRDSMTDLDEYDPE